jgi:hypothetical protein
MSRRHITKQQAELYMKHRNDKQCTQEASAAKAAMSIRSGYTIEQGQHHTQKPKKLRTHKTRSSAIDEVWDNELVGMLAKNHSLQAMTLFIHLQRSYKDEQGQPLYNRHILRTLQRKVARWRALYGPGADVMFPQNHQPGQQSLSDFTHMGKLGITINHQHFKHMLYHFRLVFSKWSYVSVVQGGESFQALSQGLQAALSQLGGSTNEHRTDSLSAAYKNIHPSMHDDTTKSYEDLCAHYSMTPTRNNKGVSHENGSVESSHGHIKNRIAQELILRGSSDFDSVHAYEQWVQVIVSDSNKRNSVNINLEKKALTPLPCHATMDYEQISTKVSKFSMIIIRNMTYSVPSRLAGHTLTVHLYQGRIDLYLGSAQVGTLIRHHRKTQGSRYVIQYHHVIHALIRKPAAFRHCKYQNELIPSDSYYQIWQYLNDTQSFDAAPKMFLRLLKCAADYECEQALGEYVLSLIRSNADVSLAAIEAKFNQSNPSLPVAASIQHELSDYNKYIPCCLNTQQGAIHHAAT